LGAGSISWLLAQTFWVGGLWLLHFVVLPGLEKMGLAPMLVDEAGAALRPLLVGFAGFAAYCSWLSCCRKRAGCVCWLTCVVSCC